MSGLYCRTCGDAACTSDMHRDGHVLTPHWPGTLTTCPECVLLMTEEDERSYDEMEYGD